MKKIALEKMLDGLVKFHLRKVELTIQTDTFATTNTYDEFNYEVTFNDEKEKDYLVFSDIADTQNFAIKVESIREISLSGENNIFCAVYDLRLDQETKIYLCLAEDSVKCMRCGRIINEDKYATGWQLESKSINYGSIFDGLGVHKFDFCDDCAWELSRMNDVFTDESQQPTTLKGSGL